MKRILKGIAIVLVVIGTLFLIGTVALHHFVKQGNIRYAMSDLRVLGNAWAAYAVENNGKSPDSLNDLLNDEYLSPGYFSTYEGTPRYRAESFPEIVYDGTMRFEELEGSTILAKQKWSEDLLLVLYADGQVKSMKP